MLLRVLCNGFDINDGLSSLAINAVAAVSRSVVCIALLDTSCCDGAVTVL